MCATAALLAQPVAVSDSKYWHQKKGTGEMKLKIVVFLFALAVSGVSFAQDGAAMYKTKCSACHGAGGEGKGSFPAVKGTKLDAGQIATHITKGEATSKAPHNKGVSGITDDQAKAIAEYVKSLK
jgi:mono/diheme cytochrome c family protein